MARCPESSAVRKKSPLLLSIWELAEIGFVRCFVAVCDVVVAWPPARGGGRSDDGDGESSFSRAGSRRLLEK